MSTPSAAASAWAGTSPQVSGSLRDQSPARQVLTRVRVALADPIFTGFLGSCLVAMGAVGIGTTPKPDPVSQVPLLGLLRTTLLGQGLSTAAIIAGIGMLVTVWLAIGRDLRAGVGPSADRLRKAMWLWSAPLVLAPPLFSRDLYSYAAQGNMTRHGFDPYLLGPYVIPGPFADSVDPMWATTPAPYGPVFLWLAGGVSHITGNSVYLGVIGMRVLALLGIWLLLKYLPRLAACCRVNPTAALWLGVVNPLTLMHFVSGGHNDALMMGLIIAGLALALEGSPLMGSAALALAVGVKAPAAILLGITGMLWARRLKGRNIAPTAPISRGRLFLGYALSGLTALAVFAAVTALTRVGYGWIAALDTPGSVRTWLSPPTAVGMIAGGISSMLGFSITTWQLVDFVRMLAGGLTVALIAWLYLRPRPLDPVRGAALVLLLPVILGPVVQPWYLMWALIPLAAGGIRGRRANLWPASPGRVDSTNDLDSVMGTGRRRPTEAGLVMALMLGTILLSQVNGSTMIGPFGVPGTLACLVVTGVVIYRAVSAERHLFGRSAVFDLAALRPQLEAPAEAAKPATVSSLSAVPSTPGVPFRHTGATPPLESISRPA